MTCFYASRYQGAGRRAWEGCCPIRDAPSNTIYIRPRRRPSKQARSFHVLQTTMKLSMLHRLSACGLPRHAYSKCALPALGSVDGLGGASTVFSRRLSGWIWPPLRAVLTFFRRTNAAGSKDEPILPLVYTASLDSISPTDTALDPVHCAGCHCRNRAPLRSS